MATKKNNYKDSEMVGKATTGVAYSGYVRLKLASKYGVIKDLGIKNAGTNLLLKAIADYISGRSISTSIPNYLGYGSSSTASLNEGSINLPNGAKPRQRLTGRDLQPIKKKFEDEVESRTIGYEVIYTGKIVNNSADSLAISQLGLFADAESDSLLAFIDLTETQSQLSLEPGLTLVVEWTMQVKNANVEGN